MTDLSAKKKSNPYAKGIAVGLLCGAFAGCIVGYGMGKDSGPAPKTADSSPAASATPPADVKSAVATPPPTSHNWLTREGDEYGYSGAISEDDRKAGTAVESVHMYRYLGEKDGIYTVQAVEGGATGTISCANPCEVAKLRVAGELSRVTFNPESIMGAVLTDAFNGQLQVYRRKETDESADQ